MTETKIDEHVKASEFLPKGYTGDIRKDRFWFWFSNQQDSFTNMIADGSAWGLMCQFRLK